ncbi:MAG: antibiotic biosynthesis monooxygenase [Pseudomonadota bacterium]
MSGNGDSILALEAFEHVHNGRVAEYLEMGNLIDDQVRETEPGMLVHALTTSSESGSETVFRWLEVFENAAALDAHLSNPHVVAHIAKLNDGILSAPTDLVIYGDWNDSLKNDWANKLSGANLSFAPMHTGFFLKR